MRIVTFSRGANKVYSSNVYLLRGDWNRIEDVNTLIDVGNDPAVFGRITTISTGLGKSPVDQVILTHSHFDHIALLPAVRKAFDPVVYAHSISVGPDRVLRDGEILRSGDGTLEVIHSPGHSNDSVCLYCQEDRALFVGDTPVLIISDDGAHEEDFVLALERLCQKDVKTIYFGHGDPLHDNCNARLRRSLKNVKASLKQGV